MRSFLAPTVTPEGACPRCGKTGEAGRVRPPSAAADPHPEEEFPLSLRTVKIFAAAVVVYLGYRLLQGVE